MSFILGIAVFGQRIRTMFAVCWFILLYRWVNVVVVSSGVDWGVIFSCAKCLSGIMCASSSGLFSSPETG